MFFETPLNIVTKVKHLGHVLCNSDNIFDFSPMIYDIKSRTNGILSNFNFLSVDARIKIFNTNCTSYYGSQLINLNCQEIQKLNVAWRVSSRRILNVDRRTHSILLPPLMSGSPPITDISCRIASFFKNGIKHPSHNISFFFSNCFLLKDSIMFKNLSHISNETGFSIGNIVNDNLKTLHIKNQLKLKNKYDYLWKVDIIKELIDISEHNLYSSLDANEVAFTLNYLCRQ